MPIIETDGLLRIRNRVNEVLGVSFNNESVILQGENPITRLMINALERRQFSYCGFHYFGPLMTTIGKRNRLTKIKQKR